VRACVRASILVHKAAAADGGTARVLGFGSVVRFLGFWLGLTSMHVCVLVVVPVVCGVWCGVVFSRSRLRSIYTGDSYYPAALES
jgi:hypothetical protein